MLIPTESVKSTLELARTWERGMAGPDPVVLYRLTFLFFM